MSSVLTELPALKAHQNRSLDRIAAIRSKGDGKTGQAILAVAPPGAGKSRVMVELSLREIAAGGAAIIKVHRRMLLRQLMQDFHNVGQSFGVVSPDYPPSPSEKIQIVSSQTLFSRAVRQSKIDLPHATLVMNDEAHQQASKMERALMFGSVSASMVQVGYLNRGIDVVGFTATPLMNSKIYNHLIDFATYSELRAETMHQLIAVYGPDEIDTSNLKPNASGDFSEAELDKRVVWIFGSVFDEWKRLNPQQLPAILFAPSVDTSKWFAHEFAKRGIPVAHLDAKHALLPGPGGTLEQHASSPEVREEVLRMSRTGEVKVVMNRFLLREAIDMPWLYHGIFATVFGSSTSALQSVGRLQRYWPEYSHKILQDHGGFYWRHGSPNMDRHWKLGQTIKDYQNERIERIYRNEEEEGIRCPKCGMWRRKGDKCFNTECQHKHSYSVRAVRTLTGRLKQMKGKVYVKATAQQQSQRVWMSSLMACGKTGKAVSNAVGMAAAKARNQGFQMDWSCVRNAPPSSTDPRYHMPVSKIYPWTLRAGGKKK